MRKTESVITKKRNTTRTSRLLSLFLAATALALPTQPVSADEIYTFVIKKQEEKATQRWTLAEWLKTRDRMRLMDLWLALHSPSPYEFYLGGDRVFGDTRGGSHSSLWRIQGAAYASIFGIEFQREMDAAARTLALFHLRIFGFHAQGTNITLHAGLRSQSAPSEFRSFTAGAGMSIYINKFFGIDGLWRHFFPAAPNSRGATYVGNRYEAGAFIDFSFLRIYGSYFSESVYGDRESNGALVGTRIYF